MTWARRPLAVVGTTFLLGGAIAPTWGAEIVVRPDIVALDVAVDAGIYEISETPGAAVHDFDDDGWADVLLSRHGEAPAGLYRNDGTGHFTEVAGGTFVRSDRHQCAAEDVNQDGLQDAICTVGAKEGIGVKANELWLQEPAGAPLAFRNEAGSFGLLAPYDRGRNTTFLDVNHDPFPDLFVGNDPDRPDRIPSPNHLYLNLGGSSFRHAPEYGLDTEVGARCTQSADANGDGWEDLLLCGQGTGLFLYQSRGGTRFAEVSSSLGIIETEGISDAVLADLNSDGMLDLVEVFEKELRVLLQVEGVFQTVYERPLVQGEGAATGDANGDGLLDLYIVTKGRTQNEPDILLLNEGSGDRYSEMAIPQAEAGRGNEVYPIDHDQNGLTDFLVLNGGKKAGPTQLIAFFPAMSRTSTTADVPKGRAPTAFLGASAVIEGPAETESFGTLSTLTERWEDGGWSVIPSQDMGFGNNSLRAVGAISPSDVWAVGTAYQQSTAHTLVERWDGAMWRIVTSPNLGTGDNFLFGVSPLSATDVWAVGSAKVAGVERTLTEHWDGEAWTIVPSPNSGPEHNSLHSLSALSSTNIWAVGRASVSGTDRTLIERWDGSSWRIVASPNQGKKNRNNLFGVFAVGARDVWAVGSYQAGGIYRTLIQHWTGGRWTLVPSPNVGRGDNLLLGVSAASKNDVWAVGYYVDGGTYRALTLHWDGVAWAPMSTPNVGTGAHILRAVNVRSPNKVWAVGTSYHPTAHTYLTTILLWEGSGWKVSPSESIVDQENELLAVATTPFASEAWVVGASFSIT